MDRLPEPLTTFRESVEADLRRAARLIIKVQDEIDPQFRFSTQDGDYSLVVTLLSEETTMLQKRFGPEGKFPAVQLPSGEVRSV
jgi:hypothetical protein